MPFIFEAFEIISATHTELDEFEEINTKGWGAKSKVDTTHSWTHWKGVKEVWAQSGQSSLDKRQVTVQLTVFADGVDSVRPTVIFRGKGLRISAKEKQSYES